MKKALFASILFLFLASCGNHKINQQAESEKIMILSREWSRAAGTDSLEKVLSYWADDAVCMFPGMGPVKGRESIREMLKATSGIEVSWEPREAHVSSDGDMAYVFAQNYFKAPDSTGNIITSFNKSLEIWKRQKDGSWKCVVDMYNADPTIKSIR